MPDDAAQAMASAAAQLADAPDSHNSTALSNAVKRVWASKWNERALRACKQLGVSLPDVHMSALLQPLIDAQIAFVSHTRDPRAAGNAAPPSTEGVASGPRMYIEAVTGLGESLVGNVPGQALSVLIDTQQLLSTATEAAAQGTAAAPSLVCCRPASHTGESASGHKGTQQLHEWIRGWPQHLKDHALGALSVESAPSKAWVVRPRACMQDALTSAPATSADMATTSGCDAVYGFIARSASNMEDLSDYAGAGVFDSFPTEGSVYLAS